MLYNSAFGDLIFYKLFPNSYDQAVPSWPQSIRFFL